MSGAPGDPRNTYRWRQARKRVFDEETHCHLCGQWVNQELPQEHPQSRTVDHLHALAQGGALLPERSLLRLAHRSCNAARSNRERSTGQPAHALPSAEHRASPFSGPCLCVDAPPCPHGKGDQFKPAIEW